MKHSLIAAVASLPLAAPALAGDFAFSGASFEAEANYGRYIGLATGFDRERASASAAFDLGGGALVQLDGALFLSSTSFYAAGAGAHLGYRIGEATVAGVFAHLDHWPSLSRSYLTLGAEIATGIGPFSVEAYGAHIRPLGLSAWENHIDVKAFYDFGNNLSLGAGGHYTWYNAPGDSWQASLAARYAFADDLYLEAGYSYTRPSMSPDAHVIGLRLVKTLGGGTPFASRDYGNIWNGF